MTKTEDIPAGAMAYAERACKTILEATRKMITLALGGEYKLVIIAVKKDDHGNDAYAVMSHVDAKDEMVAIMREAARRSTDGTMIDNDDIHYPKH